MELIDQLTKRINLRSEPIKEIIPPSSVPLYSKKMLMKKSMQIHIVYLGDRPQGDASTLASTHHRMLEGVLGRYYCMLEL